MKTSNSDNSLVVVFFEFLQIVTLKLWMWLPYLLCCHSNHFSLTMPPQIHEQNIAITLLFFACVPFRDGRLLMSWIEEPFLFTEVIQQALEVWLETLVWIRAWINILQVDGCIQKMRYMRNGSINERITHLCSLPSSNLRWSVSEYQTMCSWAQRQSTF